MLAMSCLSSLKNETWKQKLKFIETYGTCKKSTRQQTTCLKFDVVFFQL
jgi:hypothetical protein